MNGLSMGYTRKTCYDAMTTFKTCSPVRPLLVESHADGTSSRDVSFITQALEPPTVFMPPIPPPFPNHAQRLSGAEIERLNAWLDRGAPFD